MSPSRNAVSRFAALWTVSVTIKVVALALFLLLVLKLAGGIG